MRKIVINKNFNQRYLNRWVHNFIFDGGLNVDGVKTDLSGFFYTGIGLRYSTTTRWNVNDDYKYTPLQIVTESFLNVLDKINTFMLNGDLWENLHGNKNSTTTFPEISFLHTITTLLTSNTTDRDLFLDLLVNNQILTSEEVEKAKLSIPLTGFKYSYLTRNIENDQYTYTCNTPLKLNKRYLNELNTSNEKLFLFFPNAASHAMSPGQPTYEVLATNTTPATTTATVFFPYVKLWSKTRNMTVPQFGYIAFELGLEGSGADIEVDHLDKIDYLDNFKFTFDIPKEIN